MCGGDRGEELVTRESRLNPRSQILDARRGHKDSDEPRGSCGGYGYSAGAKDAGLVAIGDDDSVSSSAGSDCPGVSSCQAVAVGAWSANHVETESQRCKCVACALYDQEWIAPRSTWFGNE